MPIDLNTVTMLHVSFSFFVSVSVSQKVPTFTIFLRLNAVQRKKCAVPTLM